MTTAAPARLVALILVLAVSLAACSGSDDGDPTPTAGAPTLAPATLQPDATEAPAVLGGSLSSDGICQVTIPDDWSDDGTARGRTSTNARWTLFGNRLASDTAWATAVQLLKDQQGSRPGAVVDETADRVTITQPENRSFVVRQRFADRYCELSITSSASVGPEALALWQQVASGMGPAEATG